MDNFLTFSKLSLEQRKSLHIMFPYYKILAGSQSMPFGKLPVWMAFLELEDIHESAQPCDFFFFFPFQKASGKTFPTCNLLRKMWEHINHGFLQKELGAILLELKRSTLLLSRNHKTIREMLAGNLDMDPTEY